MARFPALFLILLVLSGTTSGCASSMRPLEEERLHQLEARGVRFERETRRKNPWIAGSLGLLAPFCNIYLAYGTGRNEQLPMAALNLFAWPVSVLWAVPGCAMDTKTVNRLQFLSENLDPS